MAFPDEEYSKYFVAGISRSITADDLRSYFTKFGSVVDAKVQKDQGGLSLGYGWVTFERPNPDVLNTTHSLNGQQLSIQLPRARPPAPGGAVVAPSSAHVGAPAASSTAAPSGTAPSVAPWASRAPHPSLTDARKRSRSRDHRDDHRRRSHSRSRNERHERHHHNHTASSVGGYPPPPPGPPPALPVSQSAPNTTLPLGCDLYQPMEYMLCIPVSLCPPEYLRDRRVLFATLDHRTGQLAQASPPPLGALPPVGAGMPPAAVVMSSAQIPVPPHAQALQQFSAPTPYSHAAPIQIHVAHEVPNRAVHHNHQQQQHHHLQLRLPHPQQHSGAPPGHSSSQRQHYDA